MKNWGKLIMSRISSTESDGIQKYNDYFKGLYNRNKKFLIISAAFYFLALFIGLLIGYFLPSSIEPFLLSIIRTDRMFVRQNGISTLSILTHNLYSVFLTYVGGIIGIITAAILFLNGFTYGSFLGYLSSNHQIASTIGNVTPALYIIYTVPHGVFEITGFIIAGAAGFRLTIAIVDMLRSDSLVSDHYWEFKDSIAMLGISIVLIIIAAIIEANITLHLGNYITHLL